jgi:hypothetical protein
MIDQLACTRREPTAYSRVVPHDGRLKMLVSSKYTLV